MKSCYVIFFQDSDIDEVTEMGIEAYAQKREMNVSWGNGDAGTLTRKDGVTACRYFVGARLT